MISRVVLNSSNQKELQTLAGANSSGLPVGSIIALYSSTCPYGYLPCNGSTYDTLQFPELYALLGTNKLPDFSECTLVGIGESSNEYDADTNPTGIKEHDVFVLGQFKDDQFQGHRHTLNDPGHTHNVTALRGRRTDSWEGENWTASDWSIGGVAYLTDYAQLRKTGITVTDPSTDETNGTPRTGSVTRQKSIGVNYVIKATPGVVENSSMPLADIAINYYTTLPTAEAELLGRVAFQKSDNRFYKCELNSGVYEWTELVTSDNDLIPYSQTPHYYDEDRWIIQVITLTNGKSQIKEGSLFTTAAYLTESTYFEESSADTFTSLSPNKAFWVDENGCRQITEIDVSAGMVISVELDDSTVFNIDTADGYAYLNPDDTVTNGYCIFAENLNHVTALGGGSGNTTTFVGTYDEWNSLSEAQKNEYTQADIVDRFPPAEGESVPLGSTISYEGSTVPAGYLECDGSTFDADRYPALAMLLGSNVLPEIFDHDKVGAPEVAFTDTASNYNGMFTVPYDGLFTFMMWASVAGTNKFVAINNDIRAGAGPQTAGVVASFGCAGTGIYESATIEAKKGDTFYWFGSSTAIRINARYYKKHMAIKATSSYASDTENTLFNQIKDYVNNQNILSDWENYTYTVNVNSPAPYDGYISLYKTLASAYHSNQIYIDDVLITNLYTSVDTSQQICLPFRKGQNIRISDNYGLATPTVAYYKLRDYTGR